MKLEQNSKKSRKQKCVGLPSRPEMDDDRGRVFPASQAAHRAAAADQPTRDRRHQTNDTHPCGPASSLYQRPHSA